MQVDFGQLLMPNVDGGQTRVYAAAFLLSASRYKYAELQSRPFTAADLVNISHNCFRYFGGMPCEMVFDQDSIVCVSENAGDIVYTYEFEKFRQETKMTIYMCRGADPESKGKIENTVKYLKDFLTHKTKERPKPEAIATALPVADTKYHVATQKHIWRWPRAVLTLGTPLLLKP